MLGLLLAKPLKLPMAPGIQKPSLEGLGAHIHLVSPDVYTDLDVVLAADDIERILYTENVGPAFETVVKPRSPK